MFWLGLLLGAWLGFFLGIMVMAVFQQGDVDTEDWR